MFLRPLKLKDVKDCVNLSLNFLEDVKAEEKGYLVDKESIGDSFIDEIENSKTLTVGVEENKKLIGILVMYVSKSILSQFHTKASEIIWHTDNKVNKVKRAKAMILMHGYLDKWAKKNQIRTIHISCPLDNDIHKFLERRGYQPIEYNYIKVVQK